MSEARPEQRTTGGRGSARPASAAFVALTALAAVLILRWNGRQWFFLDEFDFLAGRRLGSAKDLLSPHNEHWTTIPIVIYRVLWTFVGLNEYWPYQLPVLAAHLVSCALLRVVMRRAGVDPWTATVGAAALLFFGHGREDLAWGFQVTFTGALALGLVHLLAADHDGPFGRRDLAGLAAGFGALMCSGVGVFMIGIVGLSVLLRRGWRVAAGHLAAPVVVLVTWRLLFPPQQRLPTASVHDTATLAWGIVTGTFGALGGGAAGGAVLALLVAGGTATWVRSHQPSVRGPGAPVVACAAGGLAFAVAVSPTRAVFAPVPPGRYLHIEAALLLPLLVVTVSALARERKILRPVVLLALAIGIPANVEHLAPDHSYRFTLGNRQDLLVEADEALRTDAPATLRLEPRINDGITVGWLVAGRRSGRIPPPDRPVDPRLRDSARLRLTLEPLAGPPEARSDRCRPAGAGPVELHEAELLVVRGSSYRVARAAGTGRGSVDYTLLGPDDAPFSPGYQELRVLRPVVVTLTPTSPTPTTFEVCAG